MMRVFFNIAFFVVGAVLLMYLGWIVHCLLDRVCVRHARRFCERSGLKVCRVRWQMAYYESGVKTEFTLVQLDCFDAQRQRKLVLLRVWPFGVRKMVSNETYPESYDEQWPQKGAL
jgi:hypothetical protein